MKKLVGTMLVVLVATLGIAPAAAGSANLKKFCKANVATDIAEDGPPQKALETMRATAPPDIAETVNTALDQFEEQGEAAFEDPAFEALIREIDQYVIDNCGYEVVEVSLQDYAFEGIPEEVEKGTVAFDITNEGTELHEIAFLRLKGDATLDDLKELPEDATEKQVAKLAAFVPGGGFAFPGGTDVALVPFKKTGRYLAICFIPVGSTPDTAEAGGGDGPPHFVEGMAAEFEVV